VRGIIKGSKLLYANPDEASEIAVLPVAERFRDGLWTG
jgi:hypothetical protein